MKHFLPRLLNRLRILKKINLEQTCIVNGSKVRIPIINKTGFGNLFTGELWMIKLVEDMLAIKKGGFIDVGANIGQTLIKVKSIDPGISYIGIEPNPACVFYLNELTRLNRYSNCKLLPVGISTRTSVMELEHYSESDTDSAASIIKGFRPGEKVKGKTFVPVFDFSKLVEPSINADVSIIKIDVEGAESEVIESMKSTISRLRPFIICEILPVYREENVFRKERQEKIEEMLKVLNYAIYRIIKSDDEKSIRKLECINSIGIHSDIKLCDYLFVPGELNHTVSINVFSTL